MLKKLLRFLASLRRYASLVTEDYTEEITSTVDEDSAEAIRKHRRRSLLRQQDVHKLPPAKQIRYYYLRLLHRHNEWPNASTARENLPQEMASIYEKARYSDASLTQEEVEVFKTGTRKV